MKLCLLLERIEGKPTRGVHDMMPTFLLHFNYTAQGLLARHPNTAGGDAYQQRCLSCRVLTKVRLVKSWSLATILALRTGTQPTSESTSVSRSVGCFSVFFFYYVVEWKCFYRLQMAKRTDSHMKFFNCFESIQQAFITAATTQTG